MPEITKIQKHTESQESRHESEHHVICCENRMVWALKDRENQTFSKKKGFCQAKRLRKFNINFI